MNVKIMYDPTPIRHIAVQCPSCDRWFNGRDIADNDITYDYDLHSAQFECPVCGKIFGSDAYSNHSNIKIEECDSHNEVYKDIYRKVEKWEKS